MMLVTLIKMMCLISIGVKGTHVGIYISFKSVCVQFGMRETDNGNPFLTHAFRLVGIMNQFFCCLEHFIEII